MYFFDFIQNLFFLIVKVYKDKQNNQKSLQDLLMGHESLLLMRNPQV